MTDHPIPDDLLETMARRFSGVSDRVWDAEPEAYRSAAVGIVADMLQALAEWADGALIDPQGWRRIDAVEIGTEAEAADRLEKTEGELASAVAAVRLLAANIEENGEWGREALDAARGVLGRAG